MKPSELAERLNKLAFHGESGEFPRSVNEDLRLAAAKLVEMEEALTQPVTDEEWSAAYLDMFSLTMGDEGVEVEASPNQRGAIVTQILLRRRAARALGDA